MICITSMLYMIMLSMSLTFMFLEHPLSMGFILLVQTTLIAMITGTVSHNFWFSYILFMIMIGGMLVLFIYMTSVASNEKFTYSTSLMFLIILTSSTMLMVPFTDQFFSYQNSTSVDTKSSTINLFYILSMSKYLNFPLNTWLVTLIVYLLMALIAVVKITNITYGPLRQKM